MPSPPTSNPELLAIRSRKSSARKILSEVISEILASPNPPEKLELAIVLISLSNDLLKEE